MEDGGWSRRLRAILHPQSSILAFAILVVLFSSGHAKAEEKPDQVMTMSVVPGMMKFDVNRFTVRPDSVVQLVLKNGDAMPHNWVLVNGKPGEAELEIARLGWSMPDAANKGYVPESPLIIASTAMLNPGQDQTITFRTPKSEGEVPYVCTYPGHAMVMRGVMRVSKTDPLGAAPPAALAKLSYSYYEGGWKNVSELEKLDPKADADLDKGIITLTGRKRDANYGMIFDAELVVREAGKYRFFVGGDGGFRLSVNDKQLVNVGSKSRVYHIKDGELVLKPGVYSFRLEYFHREGPPELALACRFEGTSTEVFSLSDYDITDRVGGMMLTVGAEPQVVRLSLADASPRSIAVGLLGGTNYCFDADGCFIRYAWSGDFLDVSAERGNGTGRGGELCKIPETYSVGAPNKQPLRIGTSSEKQTPRFLGYTRNGANPPGFMYEIGQTKVTQTTSAIPNSRGLVYHFKLDPPPAEPLTFEMNRKGLHVASSVGSWSGDVLTIPPGKAGEFTITVGVDAPVNASADNKANAHGAHQHAH